ncbi:hypothetical protein V2J09_020381 [Rumex salicifolius]
MPTVQEVILPTTSNGTLHIHEFADVSDSATGRVLTGSWTWDSAFVLSRYISTRSDSAEFTLLGKTVLELGAGTGLPGLTAARLGATRVVLTDVPALLPGLRRNVEVNGLVDRVEACELVWGSDELPSQLFESVDLVLMSDVFYDPEEMAALARTLKGVCGAETRVWAASEVRESTGECLDELASYGFGVSEVMSQTRPRGGDGSEVFAVYQLVPPN